MKTATGTLRYSLSFQRQAVHADGPMALYWSMVDEVDCLLDELTAYYTVSGKPESKIDSLKLVETDSGMVTQWIVRLDGMMERAFAEWSPDEEIAEIFMSIKRRCRALLNDARYTDKRLALISKLRDAFSDLKPYAVSLGDAVTHAPLECVPRPSSSDQPIRVSFDKDTWTIHIDAVRYETLNPKAFGLYQAIYEASSHPITSTNIRLAVPGMNGEKTIRRTINLLPPKLRKTVTSSTNGYWITLPQQKKIVRS